VAPATPLQARYIHTKPIHPSQEIVEENAQYTLFSLQLIPNYELESRILSFGEHVKALTPKEPQIRIVERLEAARKRYLEREE
jgi:predicted DNA-binding transcriptional regulator YafY